MARQYDQTVGNVFDPYDDVPREVRGAGRIRQSGLQRLLAQLPQAALEIAENIGGNIQAKNELDFRKEQARKTEERQIERDNRADYERTLSRLGKYDYANMKKVADQYGYEDDSMSFASMIDDQNNTLSSLRDKINQVQNLDAEATYFDYDKIAKDISPQDIEMLSERDKFGYDTLVNAKKRFDTQRRTGMRTMSESDKTKYENFNKLYLQSENALVKAYADLGVDIRGRSFEDSSSLLKTLSESGINPTDEITSLTRDVDRFSQQIKNLDSKYKINQPTQEINLPGEEVPALYGQGLGVRLPEGETQETFYTSDQILEDKLPDSPASALSQEEKADALYTLASATEDSPEYKEAQAKIGDIDSLNILKSKPLPGIGGLREKLSVMGQEKEETGGSGLGIKPSAIAFKLPPVENPNNPEYIDRVIDQFDRTANKLKTLTLNPEQYKGISASDKVREINANLKARDTLVAQIKEVYKRMPKTKKFKKQLESIQSILKKNPTGLEAFLDTKARRGKGAFKFKKGKTSKEDQDLLAELSNILNFEDGLEQNQEEDSSIERILKTISFPTMRADTPSGFNQMQD